MKVKPEGFLDDFTDFYVSIFVYNLTYFRLAQNGPTQR
jgi:hypothetical protein